jgi:hypothetical protein
MIIRHIKKSFNLKNENENHKLANTSLFLINKD